MRKKRGNIKAVINYMETPYTDWEIWTTLHLLSEWFMIETVTDEKVYTSVDLEELFRAITETPAGGAARDQIDKK